MSKTPALSLSHVGVYVQDLDTMRDFYTNVMGYTVTDEDVNEQRGIVFMSQDPREHHQFVIATGRPSDLSFNLINQISLRADSLATLKRMHSALKADPRVSQIEPITHGNALSIYFRDPEGNRIEVFIDTPFYITQPCRIPFDLERSDEEIWADAEAVAKTQPGFRPVEDWRSDVTVAMGLAD